MMPSATPTAPPALQESAARLLVVREARSWIGTPMHMGARVKGRDGGIDCFTIMAETWRNCHLSAPWQAEFYRGDWWCHDTTNGYLRTILKYARQVPEGTRDTRPGNLVLVRRRTGPAGERTADWHGAIITQWPLVVHAYAPRVAEDNCLAHPAFTAGELVFFNPFQAPEPDPAPEPEEGA